MKKVRLIRRFALSVILGLKEVSKKPLTLRQKMKMSEKVFTGNGLPGRQNSIGRKELPTMTDTLRK